MKLRAKKITSNPCLVRHRASDGGYLDTFHVEGGDIVELNPDDFEVIDVDGDLRIGLLIKKLMDDSGKPTQEPIEMPRRYKYKEPTIGFLNDDDVVLDYHYEEWMKQVTKAINKLQEDR